MKPFVQKSWLAAAGIAVAWLSSSAARAFEFQATESYPPKILEPPAAQIRTDLDTRPLVVIRYPIAADPATHDRLVKRYATEGRWFEITHPDRADPGTFDVALGETAYYGASLERCLKHWLPDSVDVLLEPTALSFDAAGVVVETGPGLTVPATLVVDYFGYTSPGQFNFLVNTEHTTFGNWLLPIISVRGPREALPATNGAIAGQTYISGHLGPSGGSADPADARSGDRANLAEFLNSPERKPLKLSKRLPPKAVIEARPWQPNTYLSIHSAFFVLDPDKEEGEGRWGQSPFCRGVALIAKDALAHLTQTPTVETRRLASYASQFDAAFAERLRSGSTTAEDQQRMVTVRAFYQAELGFLTSLSHKVSTATLEGPWGDGFRHQRIEQIAWAETAKHNFRMMLLKATVASVAVSAVTAPSTNMLTVYRPGANTDARVSAQAAATGESAAQAPIVVDLAGERHEVKAQSLPELREALRQIWNRQIK